MVTGGPSRGARVAVGATPVTVGRGLGNDLVIDDPRASRRHLQAWVAAAGLMVADLGSRNGTRVAGRVVDGARAVAAGQVITIGRSEVTVDPAGVLPPPQSRGLAAACRRVRALLERSIDDELGGDEREFMREHLAGCRECLARHDLERAWREVIADALREEMPAALVARVGEALRSEVRL